jgi:hypothetical protein
MSLTSYLAAPSRDLTMRLAARAGIYDRQVRHGKAFSGANREFSRNPAADSRMALVFPGGLKVFAIRRCE